MRCALTKVAIAQLIDDNAVIVPRDLSELVDLRAHICGDTWIASTVLYSTDDLFTDFYTCVDLERAELLTIDFFY